jgi:hypothetical protein
MGAPLPTREPVIRRQSFSARKVNDAFDTFDNSGKRVLNVVQSSGENGTFTETKRSSFMTNTQYSEPVQVSVTERPSRTYQVIGKPLEVLLSSNPTPIPQTTWTNYNSSNAEKIKTFVHPITTHVSSYQSSQPIQEEIKTKTYTAYNTPIIGIPENRTIRSEIKVERSNHIDNTDTAKLAVNDNFQQRNSMRQSFRVQKGDRPSMYTNEINNSLSKGPVMGIKYEEPKTSYQGESIISNCSTHIGYAQYPTNTTFGTKLESDTRSYYLTSKSLSKGRPEGESNQMKNDIYGQKLGGAESTEVKEKRQSFSYHCPKDGQQA